MYVFVRNGGTWSQQQELTAADGAAGDAFGSSVALSNDGTTALIGALYRNHNQGVAYVFVRNGSVWSQQQELTASDGTAGDFFGDSMALSDDGTTALIGAESKVIAGMSGTGVAYVFVRSGGVWSQQQELTATDNSLDDSFGNAVALSGDGATALIGALGLLNSNGTYFSAGAAYVFVHSGSTWSLQQEFVGAASLPTSPDPFGASVALSSDGTTALIQVNGNIISAQVGVFVRSGSTWSQQATLAFGPPSGPYAALSLSSNGNTALIGAAGSGSAGVFARSGSTWSQPQVLIASDGMPSDLFGVSVALSSDGTMALAGAPGYNGYQGAAYVFTPAPTGAITPTVGSPFETRVVVTGANFLPNEPMNVYWDTTPLLTATASATGTCTTSFIVPNAPAGSHAVILKGQTSNRSISSAFQVRPALFVHPTSGKAGSLAYAIGVGFGAREGVVALWYPGKLYRGYGIASAQGSVVLPFSVPTVPAGSSYQVIGYGLNTKLSASAAFAVTAQVAAQAR